MNMKNRTRHFVKCRRACTMATNIHDRSRMQDVFNPRLSLIKRSRKWLKAQKRRLQRSERLFQGEISANWSLLSARCLTNLILTTVSKRRVARTPRTVARDVTEVAYKWRVLKVDTSWPLVAPTSSQLRLRSDDITDATVSNQPQQ